MIKKFTSSVFSLATYVICSAQVGIGTTSPSGMLHITPVSSSAIIIDPYNTAAGNTGEIQFKELSGNGSNYTGLKAPDDISSNLTFTLPNADGTNGQALSTDGSNVLSWADPGDGIWEEIGRTTLASSSDVITVDGVSQTSDFQDDYSTNSGWTQVGTTVLVDDPSFTDVVKWNVTTNVNTDQRVYKSLGTTLSNVRWYADYDFTPQGYGQSSHYSVFALAAGASPPNTSNQDALIHRFTVNAMGPGNNDVSIYYKDGSGALTAIAAHDNNSLFNNGNTIYFRLTRESATSFKLQWFTDAARTTEGSGSPISGTIPSSVVDLTHLHHTNDEGTNWGAGYTMTAQLDNTYIWNNVNPGDGFPARKHLMVLAHIIPSGSVSERLRFNSDAGSNYAARYSFNGGSDSSPINQTAVDILGLAANTNRYRVINIINGYDKEKLLIDEGSENSGAGSGNAPARFEVIGKWTNTSDPITSLSITNTGTGDYAVGSEIVVLGFKNEFSCGGALHDDRDGKDYNTVLIGGNTSPYCLSGSDKQCWMAENLNYGTRINGASNQTNNGTIEKYCYSDSESNCDTYGGLYQWDEMMDYGSSVSGNGPGPQGLCPNGWHIPTDEEIKCLEMNLGMSQAQADLSGAWRGTTEGSEIKDDVLWNGSNTSGFSLLPGGWRSNTATFQYLGSRGYFWASTENGGTAAWDRVFLDGNATIYRNGNLKTFGFSVRCVKD